ncbi:MAG: hypothetical protein WCZ23_12185 [Rhodospirillaceae bacterium]
MTDSVTDNASGNGPIAWPPRELVGLFSEPEPLIKAIKDLLGSGFEHADLSVLSSHEAVEAADPHGQTWRDRMMPLLDEPRYEVPLLTGALIAIASGPVGAVIAGLVAAGIGGVALKEMLEKVVSLPDTQEYAEAVEKGELVLWVNSPDAKAEGRARPVLERHGARNIHIVERTPADRPDTDA